MSRRSDPAQWIAAAIFAIVTSSLLVVGGCATPAGRPRLIVFTSPNCQPCLEDYPTVRLIRDSFPVEVKTYTVENYPDLFNQWGVKKLPTYVLIYDGRELYRTNQAELARRYIERLYQ